MRTSDLHHAGSGRHERLSELVLLLTAIVAAWGCSRREAEPPAAVRDYASLTDGLRAAGATTQPGGEISQPFFSVPGRVLRVNGEDVQVFEYRDEAAASAEAGLVSRDGRTIGTTQVTWVATPHFYKAGRVIVLYVGQNAGVTGMLTAILGPPFAGG